MLCKCVRRLQFRIAPSPDSSSASKHPAQSNSVLRQRRRPQNYVLAATDFDAMSKLAYDFEVFGKVQGVFFRASTIDAAKQLGVVGWVANSGRDTVVGHVQGNRPAAEKMKVFLTKEGSPSSNISRCDIRNEREIGDLEFAEFSKKGQVD